MLLSIPPLHLTLPALIPRLVELKAVKYSCFSSFHLFIRIIITQSHSLQTHINRRKKTTLIVDCNASQSRLNHPHSSVSCAHCTTNYKAINVGGGPTVSRQ